MGALKHNKNFIETIELFVLLTVWRYINPHLAPFISLELCVSLSLGVISAVI